MYPQDTFTSIDRCDTAERATCRDTVGEPFKLSDGDVTIVTQIPRDAFVKYFFRAALGLHPESTKRVETNEDGLYLGPRQNLFKKPYQFKSNFRTVKLMRRQLFLYQHRTYCRGVFYHIIQMLVFTLTTLQLSSSA
jgi:hypothetical protein